MTGLFSREQNGTNVPVLTASSTEASASVHMEGASNTNSQNLVNQQPDPATVENHDRYNDYRTVYTAENMHYECPVENRYDALQTNDDVTAPGPVTYRDAVNRDRTQDHSEIPVRISGRQRKTFKPRVITARPTYTSQANPQINVRKARILMGTLFNTFAVNQVAAVSAVLILALRSKWLWHIFLGEVD